MRLFLDSSVFLAACGSERGASRFIFTSAAAYGWDLLATSYATGEVQTNIADLGTTAEKTWSLLMPQLTIVPDVFTVDRPVVFSAGKDRPILLSALAWADVPAAPSIYHRPQSTIEFQGDADNHRKVLSAGREQATPALRIARGSAGRPGTSR